MSLCDKESFALHCLQVRVVVSIKFIAARRPRVGKMSWMTAYHADRISFGARDSLGFATLGTILHPVVCGQYASPGVLFRQRPSEIVSHINVS